MSLLSKSVLLIGSFLLAVSESGAQQQEQIKPPNATMHPCPGGIFSLELDIDSAPSLEDLVYASDLIVVGTVTNVQAAVLTKADRPNLTETHSEIAITRTLFGTLPGGGNSILLAQTGGTVGPCAVEVPSNPLLNFKEDYILFLRVDDRAFPQSAVKLPRYNSVGAWNGKAKIVEGKVEFLPAATSYLRKYDKTDVGEFVQQVERLVKVIYPQGVKLPTSKTLPPPIPPTTRRTPPPLGPPTTQAPR